MNHSDPPETDSCFGWECTYKFPSTLRLKNFLRPRGCKCNHCTPWIRLWCTGIRLYGLFQLMWYNYLTLLKLSCCCDRQTYMLCIVLFVYVVLRLPFTRTQILKLGVGSCENDLRKPFVYKNFMYNNPWPHVMHNCLQSFGLITAEPVLVNTSIAVLLTFVYCTNSLPMLQEPQISVHYMRLIYSQPLNCRLLLSRKYKQLAYDKVLFNLHI